MELILSSHICIDEEWTLFVGVKDEEGYAVHVVSDKVEGRRVIRAAASQSPEIRSEALTDIETSELPETSDAQTVVISGESATYLVWALEVHGEETEDEIEQNEGGEEETENDEDAVDDSPYCLYLIFTVRSAKTSDVGAMFGYYGPDEQYHLFLFSNAEDGLAHLEEKLGWLDEERKEDVRISIGWSFPERTRPGENRKPPLHLTGTPAEFLGSLAAAYEELFGSEDEGVPESESYDTN